ncbi:antifreeze protein [Cereibacter sphaeroides]|uniref:antifreeze protein n=1 Tax=Cereibacter sphaeroides TaxID=1063 RepID=UPI001F237776|nr:antifreeze protein [Cereibacter sphaeroides]MCE6950930.1 antifreeze protein [Cereibacter sphaeroides]MCE6960460.1 antifreeze protein [Cereibacter sphaeroides]MCE6969410.1 antifreeze protein [Cereibacter sphaeroides]MCE6975468.1 antifreeze protein [Cereibacter sphaeroides]
MTLALPIAEMMKLSWQMGLMVAEAQTVMTLRTLGMMGVLTPHPMENQRMVAEKGRAFAQAAQAATAAAMQGKRPDEVAAAALKPIRRRTRANAARLTRAAKKPRV